jgi:monoamine oxidase
MSEPEQFDAIIIGAGAAGLAAASELRGAGRSVVVIEARNRVGGRILTYRDAAIPVPIELGAEFLHGATPYTDTIIDTAGLTAIDVGGDRWQASGGRFKEADDGKKVDRVLRKLDEHRMPDRTFSEYLAERAVRKPKRKDARARSMAMGFVQGFHAADPAIISEQWLAKASGPNGPANGSRSGRVAAGYDRVTAWLAREVFDAVELNTVVTDVQWARGNVTVTCMDANQFIKTYSGKTVIVTVPISILQIPAGESGSITFTPEIPAIADAVDGIAMGSALRTVFAFRDRFWETLPNAPRENGGLASLSFLQSKESQFPIWWTAFPVRAPLMVGWVGGPAAAELYTHPDEDIERLALMALASHLGMPYEELAGLVRGSWMHNWDTDPFSRGAYSYARVGGSGSARRLARPVEQTIFMAGEATDTDRSGTVEGALATGSRAARGVLQALGVGLEPSSE